jgi:hypothetical protein
LAPSKALSSPIKKRSKLFAGSFAPAGDSLGSREVAVVGAKEAVGHRASASAQVKGSLVEEKEPLTWAEASSARENNPLARSKEPLPDTDERLPAP